MVGGEGGVYPHPHIPYTSTQRYKGLTPTSTYFFFGGWGAVHTNYLGWRSGRVDPTGFGDSAVIQRPARTREAPSPPTPLPPVPPIANRRPHRAPQIIHRSTEGYGGGGNAGSTALPWGRTRGSACVYGGAGGAAPHPLVCNTRVCVQPGAASPSRWALTCSPSMGRGSLGFIFIRGRGCVRVCVYGVGGGERDKTKEML